MLRLLWNGLIILSLCSVSCGDDRLSRKSDPPVAPVEEIIPPEECPAMEGFNGDSIELDVGTETTWNFAGVNTEIKETGTFNVYKTTGEDIKGPIETDKETGEYTVQIPLFCGDQQVILAWENDKCRYVIGYNITTVDCIRELRLTIAWDDLGRDWELHLIKPGGTINDDATDCTWTSCINEAPDWGVIGDESDDPHKDVDDLDGFGPESIFLSKLEAGTYTVLIEHWNMEGDPNSTGTLTINLGDYSVENTIEKIAPYEVWTGATIDWPSGEVTLSQEIYDCTDNWSGGCKDPLPFP